MTCEYDEFPNKKIYKDPAAQILLECADLLEKKGQDYNGGGVTRDDYALFGAKSHMHMIHTKYLRLRSLMQQSDDHGSTPNFESFEDTLKDLLNYCAIFIDWSRRNENK